MARKEQKDESDSEAAESVYADYRRDLLSRQLSNSQKYDSSILSLSMAALGFSLTFIGNIVPLDTSICLWILCVSWFLYSLSIIFVVISFQVSNWAINQQIEYAEKYYLQGDRDYADKENCWVKYTTNINILSGFFFISAILLTITFVIVNVSNINQEVTMQKKEGHTFIGGAEVPKMQILRGAETEKIAPSLNSPSDSSKRKGKLESWKEDIRE
ncbi:MAG: hypothetical protein KJ017_04735 [Alphaproteobacteria bacterium]|nr:hypothetical protein [Alphaproteobacteria bacterium]